MVSVWQSFMIALARSGSLTRFVQRNPRISSAASQFVGGTDEDSALRTALALKQQGIRASLFFLGEYITDPAITRQTVDSLQRLLPALDAHGLDTHVSVDPTQIGYAIRPELGEENALRLAASFPAQHSTRSFLMIDMEDASYVDCTIALRSLLASRGVPAAITLQAYLRRTESDLASLLRDRVPCVRLVKGAFSEPGGIAWTHSAEISAAYLRLAAVMLSDQARKSGLFPVFATHNEALIDSIRALARESGYAPGEYEFEMLYGVRPKLQAKILAAGDQLRLYVPYGAHWWPYTARRIGENPQNLIFVWRALAGR
ncbi:MAG: proline dehydrogenase family protein [Bryobacteraceae bacterium]|jgi:proline dehydrogenase